MVMLLEKTLVPKTQKIISIICLILTSIACIQPVFNAQGIYVEKIVVTDNLDKDGRPIGSVEIFHPDTIRIYCFAKIPALSNERLHVQWYYEDNLIGTVENFVSSQGEVSWFLNQPTDQPSFPEGRYRCRVTYRDIELKSISFEVKA